MNFTDSLRNDVATRHRINDINCLAHAFNLADETREHLKQAATAETTHLELHWTVDADETWLTDVMDNLLKWLDRTPQPDALAGYCGDSCDEPCTNRHMREWFINQVFDQPTHGGTKTATMKPPTPTMWTHATPTGSTTTNSKEHGSQPENRTDTPPTSCRSCSRTDGETRHCSRSTPWAKAWTRT